MHTTNESVTTKVSSENFVKNVLKENFETGYLRQSVDNKSWYYKKLNLILKNTEIFIIYCTCHHLF